MPDIKVCAVTENYINTLIRKISEQKLSYGLKLYRAVWHGSFKRVFPDGILDFDPDEKCTTAPAGETHDFPVLRYGENDFSAICKKM